MRAIRVAVRRWPTSSARVVCERWRISSVDPLEIDRRGAEVGVPELALDDAERDALAGELDRVRVAQLVRGHATPDPSSSGEPAELGADRGV
jgi:hypothetical protein